MTYVEAVRNLVDDKCEGIESTVTREIYKIRNSRLYNNLGIKEAIKKQPSVFEILGDWKLINPVKEFEEVEIIRYAEVNCLNEIGMIKTKPFTPINGSQIITLTGTIKREVKPKVKKREEVKELFLGNMSCTLEAPFRYKGREVQFFAEWYEDEA